MKIYRPLVTLFILCIYCFRMAAAEDETIMSTRIFNPLFRTLTHTVDDNFMSVPVISLDGTQQLCFSFDEISDERSYLRCRLIHCNADWRPSPLVESEYVDGFNEASIEDFGYSSNTFIRYVNYRFCLGAEGLRPLISGNYIWQVYDENDPDNVLIQARFCVSEDSSTIFAEATSRTDAGVNDEYQQVFAEAAVPSEMNANLYSDLLLVVTQNDRPDTSRFITHPMRVDGNKIIYDHINDLIFPAGNEYRRFETVRNDYPGMGVDSTRYSAPLYHAYLTPALPRDERPYIYDETQKGRYKIDEYNSTDPNLGADYIMTHFTLDFPQVMEADIFVEGDLTLRDYTDLNKMNYDAATGLYSVDIPLKQGSYNYQYVVKGKNDKRAHAAPVEGNHFQTLNEYNLYLYLKLPGSRADRLLCSRTITFRP